MAKQNFGGVYANMDFPPYQFVEYPKHIKTGRYGEYEIANNAAEEAEIRARLDAVPSDHLEPDSNFPIVVDKEKEILIARAAELGVPINRKWSKEKIRKTIEDAEKDADELPPEDGSETHSEADKDALIAKAKSLGIPASRVWGVPRLQKEIAKYEEENE